MVCDPRHTDKLMPGSDTVQFTLTSKHSIFLPLCNRGSTLPAQGLLKDDAVLKRAPQILFPRELYPAEDCRNLSGISLFHIYSPYELLKGKMVLERLGTTVRDGPS